MFKEKIIDKVGERGFQKVYGMTKKVLITINYWKD